MWDEIINVARAGLCAWKPRKGTKYRIFSDRYCELNALGMSAEYAGIRPTSAAAGEIESQVTDIHVPESPKWSAVANVRKINALVIGVQKGKLE